MAETLPLTRLYECLLFEISILPSCKCCQAYKQLHPLSPSLDSPTGFHPNALGVCVCVQLKQQHEQHGECIWQTGAGAAYFGNKSEYFQCLPWRKMLLCLVMGKQWEIRGKCIVHSLIAL